MLMKNLKSIFGALAILSPKFPWVHSLYYGHATWPQIWVNDFRYRFRSNRDFGPKHDDPSSRRDLTPDPENDMMGRDGIQTHGCGDPSTCSEGCIAAKSNDTRDAFNDAMSSEEGDNTVIVLP